MKFWKRSRRWTAAVRATRRAESRCACAGRASRGGLSEQFLNIARARWGRFAVYAMLGELAVLCPVITGFFMPAENNGAGGQRPRTHAPARKENNMAIRDLIPWNKNQLPTTGDVYDPFVTFHREMNRLFDDVFRGFGNFGSLGRPMMEGQVGWPRLELHGTDKAGTVFGDAS